MRKITKILLSVFLALTTCITVSGCTFINDGYFTPNNGGGSTSKVDSIAASQSIEFGKGEQEVDSPYSLADAYNRVFRTSVAIEMNNGGSGSGVIVDVKNSGNYVYILTCHHVISSGGAITVYVPDEEGSYENKDYIFQGQIGGDTTNNLAVTLVGGDNVSDVAVIKINLAYPALSGNKLPMDKIQKAVILSDTREIRVLETIFAIGNPLGELPGSATAGEVSYLERQVLVSEVGEMTLMQISVLTNPGNSGGGLYNLYGELIGITNAGNTSYDGINFAIPATLQNGNGFISIASQLIATQTSTNYGYISGRWNLGIEVKEYKYNGTSYVKVTNIVEGSNVYGSELKVNHIIKSVVIDGENVSGEEAPVTYAEFPNYVGLLRTKLSKGDSFDFIVLEEYSTGIYQTAFREKTVTITISVTGYIFADTGR